MSDLLDREEYESGIFALEERVSFLLQGVRLHGVVVRVYNTRELYHVEVEGERYSVRPYDDEMRRE